MTLQTFLPTKIEKIRNALSGHEIYSPPIREIKSRFDSFHELSQLEVRKIILNMKTKSCEDDIILTAIIKKHLIDFLPTITDIVNLSLQEGKFLTNWKCAIVSPLIKKLNQELELKNFRPVSNLQFISKIVECAMLDQIINHCDHQDLSPHHQSAYRKHHSCETAVLKITNDALWSLEQEKIKILVCLDLSAAFDTVDHEILLDILHHYYGIDNTPLKWFASYLQDRQMKVKIGEDFSDTHTFNYSVPQGSCSGAQIFSWYCATLIHEIPKNLDLNAYADDHTLNGDFEPKSATSEKLLVKDIQECIQNTNDWMNKNRLKLNKDKTEIIYFGSRQSLAKCNTKNIQIGDDIIPISNCIRYLGTYFDSQLIFWEHTVKKS